jgi:hypothetical protein
MPTGITWDMLGNPAFGDTTGIGLGDPYPPQAPTAIVQPVGDSCPTGYGTIYKYDGTTECIDPTTPNIAAIIQQETRGSLTDRILQTVAPTAAPGAECGWDLSCQLSRLLTTLEPWAIGVGVIVGLLAIAYVVRAFR